MHRKVVQKSSHLGFFVALESVQHFVSATWEKKQPKKQKKNNKGEHLLPTE